MSAMAESVAVAVVPFNSSARPANAVFDSIVVSKSRERERERERKRLEL